MTDTYIVPRNWDRFQHADTTKRGHAPKWIKLYTALHRDDNFLDLTGHRRAILLGIWLEYALTSGRGLRDDTARISSRLNLKVTRADLEALNHAGFLEFRQDKVQTESRRRRDLDVDVEVERPRALVVDAAKRPTTSTFGDFLKLVPPEPAA